MNERQFIGGFNFAGITDVFEARIKQAHDERTTKHFRYVELGIAQGRTFVSVAELLREICANEFQLVGVDLCNGAYFDARQFIKMSLGFDIHIEFQSGRQDPFISDKIVPQIRVLLLKSDTKRALVSNGCVNFCLIDGCHGAPCVEADFLSIEAGMAPGGIVAFHDAGPEEQDINFQPHCRQGIGVVNALQKLGLLWPEQDAFVSRMGWKFLGFTPGDRITDQNPEAIGHGIVFFQKQ
jgi:hypothetical protein